MLERQTTTQRGVGYMSIVFFWALPRWSVMLPAALADAVVLASSVLALSSSLLLPASSSLYLRKMLQIAHREGATYVMS
jgi:hypothetical protein